MLLSLCAGYFHARLPSIVPVEDIEYSPALEVLPFERDDGLSGGLGGGGSRAADISEFVDAAVNTTHNGDHVSDKVTSHAYETMYATFLLPLRDRKAADGGRRLKMLEIGVGCDMQGGSPGASATLWSKLLPTAERYMAEQDAHCVTKLGTTGLHVDGVLVGDQADESVVESWVRQSGGGFDVIIDDGGHGNHHIRNSLHVLWSALAPGGLYFVEDLHVSRSAPLRNKRNFTVAEMLHAWSEQLISSRETRPSADTEANARAAALSRRHPKPRNLAFVFFQHDAAVLGKFSPAEARAQRSHALIPDIGGGPLTSFTRPVVARMAQNFRAEAQAAKTGGQRTGERWCALLTATTHIHVDLRKTASWAAEQQVNSTERKLMYMHVLRQWIKHEPAMPIVLAENSGDELKWAEDIRRTSKHPSLELIRLSRNRHCRPDEIGCFEADAILRAVKSSALLDPRRSTSQCSHVLKITARYAPTDSVSHALRRCKPGVQMAVQTRSWGDDSMHWHGSQMFGFRATLTEAIFDWSQRAEQCQECHINQYVAELERAVNRSRIPAGAVCQLPRLNVEPVKQGSNGLLTRFL